MHSAGGTGKEAIRALIHRRKLLQITDPDQKNGLSLRRAEAVRDILASRGVGPRQMLVEGGGATQPIGDNSTPEGRAQNRRVAIYVDVPQQS